ncbi:zinc-dependent metalloprotease [Polymorphobacter fuscus]|uniref:zinc-dependent metalloprotease n=1 Tax=Sandarakinorhabdus fusca TaxID=1439888 RepID=UPI00169DE108|nr:zinc-dependent metalloprotease [Polymorphobacter fuscus]NJC07649.1 hypothetical protein [Polymorphobacter fuscus]
MTIGFRYLLLAAACLATPARAEQTLLPVTAEIATGRILLTLPPADADGVQGRYLYTTGLRTGMGSADIRLDRGMSGSTELLAFRRIGKKIAITFENPRFRAAGGTSAEKAGVANSFPVSTMAMIDIVASAADGSATIDIAPFLARDTFGITGALNEVAKGFKLVEAASAADPAAVRAFPDNIEMEAVQTFSSDTPGREIRQIAPDARAISFRVHHSLIRLPAPGFTARKFDIRSSAIGTQVFDFNQPLGRDVVGQLAVHFRLEKTDPGAARSTVRKPIIFYIDNAAPEPVRTALAEGVGWWAQAFDAAGLVDAFQVKILPEGVDPLDARYNVVHWGSRLTRSWSYGQSIVDPRTGEIVRGSVILGALRVRQDMAIFEALLGAKASNSGGPNDPVQVALARIRQLGAHEVGHAIGLMHNFAASTQGNASVMDYPGPFIELKNGKPDLTNAYAVGIGAWDKTAIDWLYAQPPGVDVDADAARRITASAARGDRFLTDIDGRAIDSPTPWSSMWDNGTDPAAELVRMMDVRRAAIAGFGPDALLPGEPMAMLRRKFVLVWLLHRYQVEAAAKLIGGVDYAYTVNGDGRPSPTAVAAPAQDAALTALLATLTPAALTVPDALVGPLSAGINGASNPQFDTEVFANAGAAVFDPLVAADVAAQATLAALLAPTRLTRVLEQHRRDPSLPDLATLLDRLVASAVPDAGDAVARRIGYRTIIALAATARDPATSPDVAALLDDRLAGLADRLARSRATGESGSWARSMARLLGDEDRLQREVDKQPRTPPIPPGMPIGSMETDWMGDF